MKIKDMQTESPKVSVIVPVYNTALLLPKCIESLISQTLENIEIILVNDASTDNSLEVMRRYEANYSDRIRVIDSKVNQRQGGARNLGIEAAKGKYLGFIDSDDWAEPEMYRLLYEEAIKKDSDLCYCYRFQVSETGNKTQDSATFFLPEGEITDESLREMLVSHVTFVQRYLYKRSIFMEHQIRFPAHIRYEDMMIDPLALLYAKHIAAVKVPLFNYFIRSGSTMTELNETKYLDKSTVCAMIIEEYKRRGYYEKFKEEINYLYYRKGYIHTSINYILNARIPSVKVVKEIRERLLVVSPSYRQNSYYKRKTTFRVIDRMLSCRCPVALWILKWILKLVGYNV